MSSIGSVPGGATAAGTVATTAAGASPTSSGEPTSATQEVSASTITQPLFRIGSNLLESRFIAAGPRRERRCVKAGCATG
jgi:hypothetical protein